MKKTNRTLKAILKFVAEEFSVPVRKIMSRKRNEAFTIPRHVVFYIARNLPGYRLSYDTIGDFFGLHHSAIVHGCSSVQDRIDTDAEFAYRVGLLLGDCISRML